MKAAILKHIDAICSIYPTIQMYDEPRERLAGRIARHVAESNAKLLRAFEAVMKRHENLRNSLNPDIAAARTAIASAKISN